MSWSWYGDTPDNLWVDPGFSSSIAADGLPLASVPLSGGTPSALVATLVGAQWAF